MAAGTKLIDLIKQGTPVRPTALTATGTYVQNAAAGAAAPAAEVAEEQTEFDVVLKGFADGQKIPVIKVVREVTSLGLKDAKDFVEHAPNMLKEDVSKEEAEKIKEKLEKVGGIVEIH